MIFSWIRQLILILRYINHDLQKCIFEKYINRIFYDQYIKNVFKGKVSNIPKSLRDQFHLSKWEGKILKKVKKKTIYHLRNTEFSLVPPFLQSKLGNKFRRLHLVFLWKFVPDLILAGFDWFLVRRPAIWDPLYRLTIFKKSLLFTLLCIKKFDRFFSTQQ